MTSHESWLDLGRDGLNDAIEDMQDVLGWLSDAIGKIRVRARYHAYESPVAEQLEEAADLVEDNAISALRAHIAQAKEALNSMPDPDATDGEVERWAKPRGRQY